MKKTIRSLSLVIAFSLLAAVVPLLRGSGMTARAAGDFVIEDGVLTAYNGAGGKVVIPDGVTEIAERVFMNHTGVTSVTLPDTVKEISIWAFNGCENLKEINLPASLTKIGYAGLSGCVSLRTVTIASGNSSFVLANGALYDKGKSRLILCMTNRSGVFGIPLTVREIDAAAFKGCGLITEIRIPAGVRSLGYGVFAGCTKLKKLSIPRSVTEFGDDCFLGAGLTDVYYESSESKWNDIPKEREDCYYDDEGDEIWETVTCGLSDSAAVHFFAYEPDKSTLTEFVVESGVLVEYNGSGGAVTLPTTVKTVGAKVFEEYPKLVSVTLREGVQKIASEAFAGCTGLKSVSLPSTLRTVSYEAFRDCTALTGLTLPQGTETVGSAAFENCTALASVSLPASLKSLADGAFFGCRSLKSVAVASGNANFRVEDGVLYNSGKTRLLLCTRGTSGYFAFPVSVRSIDNGAFGGCQKITELWMPSGVTNIPYGCFDGCTGLKKIHIPQSVTGFGYISFRGAGITDVYYQGSEGAWNAIDSSDPEEDTDCELNPGAVIHYGSYKTKPDIRIITQPGSKTVPKGSSLTISVGAKGSALRYQWYYKKKGQTEWSVWNGRTHASETVTPNDTWDGIKLYCKITDSAGQTANSSTMTVTFARELTITRQPQSQTVKKGVEITLSVKAEGSGTLTFQWYYKKKGQTEWSVWNGRTHATEKVTPNDTWDGIKLYCKVKDGTGATVNSNPATVTFGTPLKITQQPKSRSVTLGQELTLSVKAEGTGTLTYQWYFMKAEQTEWSVWKGHTKATETCTPNATWNGIKLYCEVKDSTGTKVKSSAATITLQ